MALSYNIIEYWKIPYSQDGAIGVVDITLDGDYNKGGWTIAPASLGVDTIFALKPANIDGVTLEWDTATGKLKACIDAVPGSVATGIMTDDNSAASNGTALTIVHQDENVGKLYSANATNAATTFEIGASGPVVDVYDDTGAAGGVQIYFDEDAAEGKRLQCVSPTNADLWVKTQQGAWLHIYDNNDAATAGVAVYIDDNGGTASARLLFVSPTNVSGAFYLTNEVSPGFLSGEVCRCMFMGR